MHVIMRNQLLLRLNMKTRKVRTMEGRSHTKWAWAALPEIYNDILQLQHHCVEVITKGFLDTKSAPRLPDACSIVRPLKSKALSPGSGWRETSSFRVCAYDICRSRSDASLAAYQLRTHAKI